MNKIEELNKILWQRFTNHLEQSKKKVEQINSPYPEIMEVKWRLLNYNLKQFRINVDNRLKNKLINEWIKYNSQGNINAYDMIYFEYHEQSSDHSHAYSYGIYDLAAYKLTIENYEMGADYKFDWEAGEGLILEPFATTKPIDYSKFEEEEYHNLITYNDPNSGAQEIWNYIHAICNFVFHESFKEADNFGLFKNIKLRSGGFFSYNIHDDGLSMPFYIKR